MLSEFRFFKINAGGMIDAVEYGRFSDEPAALAHARTLSGGRLIEVWQSNRRIGNVVPPQRTDRAA